ncbi:MAG: hypothetical protein ACRD43_04155 [Pyrinomonadaceae bacterium]
MRYKRLIALSTVVFLAGLGILGSNKIPAATANRLELKLDATKQTYTLGEPVELSFVLSNTGQDSLSLGCFGIGTGDVQLFISRDEKNFLRYRAGWGNVDAVCNNSIKPGGQLEIPNVKILWNYNPDLRHLNADSAAEVRKGMLTSDYAFPTPGTYYLKATAFDGLSKLESAPIKITVTDPVGDDLVIWNEMKADPDIGYFIQMGDIKTPSFQVEERDKFELKLRHIVNEHPNSLYGEMLNDGLSKFQAAEVKRKEFQEKLKKSAN